MKKRLVSILLAVVMCMGLAVPAFATEESSPSEEFNISETVNSVVDSVIQNSSAVTENGCMRLTAPDGTQYSIPMQYIEERDGDTVTVTYAASIDETTAARSECTLQRGSSSRTWTLTAEVVVLNRADPWE